jgi:uncharacterized protein
MKKIDSVVHFEMPYFDNKRVAKFYAEVFGWQMQKLGEDMGSYITAATTETDENRMIKKTGAINGGFFLQDRASEAKCPSVVIAVKNIEVSMKMIEDAGGKLLGKPMDIPGIGRYVSFSDTEGNRVSILEPKSI